jgi:membrane associated rhomboid family serine protease
LTQNITFNLIFLAVIGLVFPLLDNWAHIGGFAGGYLASRWLDPMREETQQHWIGALVCLLLMAASLLLSLLVPSV